MLRSFNTVGQGAFYTEHFSNFTLVYDCGSDRNIPLIKAQIKGAFDGVTKVDRVIDKLFISHLDSDHVNGLEFLLDYCTIREIYLPLIGKMEKMHLLLHHAVAGVENPFVTRLIKDSTGTIRAKSDSCKMIYVLPADHDGNDIQDMPQSDDRAGRDSRSSSREKDIETIASGTAVTSPNLPEDWVLVPFNYRNSIRSAELANALCQLELGLEDVASFENAWRDPVKQSAIRAAYDAVPGEANTNSMTLYSGPGTLTKRFQMVEVPWFNSDISFRFGISRLRVGCLYLGDYEAKGKTKWDELHVRYRKYWDNIGVVQIPHHGSRHNYNPHLNAEHPVFSVISCGTGNIHGHPHCSTVRNIVEKGGVPVVVTEAPGTRFQCYIFPPATSSGASFSEPGILFRISKTDASQLTPEHLYEATRGAWVLGPRRETVRYAFAVAKGIIQEAYAIERWCPAGSTSYRTRRLAQEVAIEGRWEFVGTLAEAAIREKYRGRSVAHYYKHGAINPIRYVGHKVKEPEWPIF